MGKNDKKPEFILENLDRNDLNGQPQNDDWFENSRKWLGHALCLAPFEQWTRIDFTTTAGSAMGVYYSLIFQLRKWEYFVTKFSEDIEVSPTFSQYYQITHAQREQLEGRIKSGLASASQAVADMELLKHDLRKYKEFLEYLGADYDEDKNEFTEKKKDEHTLKAMFIDLVDAHTGESVSMRSIVQRWPTLIIDFMKLKDEDTEPAKVVKRFKADEDVEISTAEAVVLVTKNKLYQQWKKLFEPEIRSRYRNILELVRSRERSVVEYRDWLKPVIARHKIINESLTSSAGRQFYKTFFVPAIGNAVSMGKYVLWTWRPFVSPEIFKGGTERTAQWIASGKLDMADEWTRKKFIFNRKQGLIVKYPWIDDKWIEEKKKEFIKNGLIRPNLPYYSFIIVTFYKSNIRTPTGQEIENGIFDVNAILMSENVLFVKLLELEASKRDFDNYVDSLIGVTPRLSDKMPEEKKKKKKLDENLEPVRKALGYFNMGMKFMKSSGPYERDFEDRITKFYLAPMGAGRYGAVVGFIKKKIGLGVA